MKEKKSISQKSACGVPIQKNNFCCATADARDDNEYSMYITFWNKILVALYLNKFSVLSNEWIDYHDKITFKRVR